VLEVEVKYAVDDFAPVEAALAARGMTAGPPRRDADHYFNAPDRDFARTDEAVRVRSIGPKNFVTYKGPKIDAETKTRLEIEVPLADGEEAAADFRRLLTHLGYRPVAVVRKSRRVAEFKRDGFDMQVTLDEVDGVGRYAELEVVASEERAHAAKTAVLAVAAEIGLTRSERRSYLQLLLEKQGTP
jgi:adenylate cyclase class 2